LLWGDHFYNDSTGKWQSDVQSSHSQSLQRSFVKFCLGPISALIKAVLDEQELVFQPMLKRLDVVIPDDAKALTGKNLLRRIMQEWIPASDALLEMIVNHLPSPLIAQRYRVENLVSKSLSEIRKILFDDVNLKIFFTKMMNVVHSY
jgi:elongation factor 2